MITKSDIINGKHNIQEVTIEKLTGIGDGKLKLRPLTDGEFHQINALMRNGGVKTMKGKLTPEEARKQKRKLSTGKSEVGFEIDPIESAEKKYEADVKAVYFSMKHEENKDEWTEQEIKDFFPAGAVEETALKVYEISGVTDPDKQRREGMEELEEEMSDFRE